MKTRKLTARQFLKRFPDSDAQSNCMEDLACPKCGQRETLHIAFHGQCSVTDDGTEDEGDHEWTDGSACSCFKCGHGGKVRDFTFPGLDALIAERAAATAQAN